MIEEVRSTRSKKVARGSSRSSTEFANVVRKKKEASTDLDFIEEESALVGASALACREASLAAVDCIYGHRSYIEVVEALVISITSPSLGRRGRVVSWGPENATCQQMGRTENQPLAL